jgi:hypothetical protein
MGSSPDEVNYFLSIYLIFGFTQPLTEISTRDKKIMFLGRKAAAGA